MTKINQYKCDVCGTKVDSKFNGEHWLPPKGWIALWDIDTAALSGEHICPQCILKSVKKPRKAKEKK